MKKRAIISVISIVFALTITVTAFAGCSLFKTKVSSYEELMSASGTVVLTADIDCNFQTVTTRTQIEKFDGQGHTIKNFVLSASGATDETSFFGPKTKSVKNVNFDGVTMTGTNVATLAVVKSCGGGTIENVHVKNTTLTATQHNSKPCMVGAIYGGVYVGKNIYETSYDAKIQNCSVENVKIDVTGRDKYSGAIYSLYAGGIAAACDNVSDCYAVDCEITATSLNPYCDAYVGGVVAYNENSVTNCYAKDNELTSSATYYNKGTYSHYSTPSAFVGGVVGFQGYDTVNAKNDVKSRTRKLQYCYGDNNEIVAKSTGDIYAGGVAGRVMSAQVGQCYAVDNTIDGSSYQTGNADDVVRRYGGLIGCVTASSVTSSFACNNEITENSSGIRTGNSQAGGLFTANSTTSASYCGAYNNDMVAPQLDELCPQVLSSILNCVVGSTTLGNTNSCELMDSDFWSNANSIKTKLRLSGSYWQFTTDLPTLNFAK